MAFTSRSFSTKSVLKVVFPSKLLIQEKYQSDVHISVQECGASSKLSPHSRLVCPVNCHLLHIFCGCAKSEKGQAWIVAGIFKQIRPLCIGEIFFFAA